MRWRSRRSKSRARQSAGSLATRSSSVHTSSADLRAPVREGTYCLIPDSIERTVCVAIATDTARDGKGFVFAYEPFSGKKDPRLSKGLRRKLLGLGLKASKSNFRTQWLDATTATAVVDKLYGPRLRRRFEKAIRPRR